MKRLLVGVSLLFSLATGAQTKSGKTGFIDYGNPSLLYVPKSAGEAQDRWSIRPGVREIAFSEDEETVFIKNPENYIYTTNPEKKTMSGWSLISQKKESYDVSQLPFSRKGRGILALFTPNYPLEAIHNGRKGSSGLSCWISADLKLTLNENYAISISDTTGKQVAAFKLPDFLEGIGPDVFKYLKSKPKDYEIDMSFRYYPKSDNLFISGDCGKYGKGYNRLWRYQLASGTLTEIPVFTSHDWDNGRGLTAFGKIFVSFAGNNIVRQYYNSYHSMNYEFISSTDGSLIGKGSMETLGEEGQDKRILAVLPAINQVVVLSHNLENDEAKRRFRIDYYDTTLTQRSKSVTLDVGKADISGTSDAFPICVSDKGKFFCFAGTFNHPDIGYYLSVNFDLLQDAEQGYINSINDIAIHKPLIENNYATADFERTQATLDQKKKDIKELQDRIDQTLSFIKKRNNELLELYQQNRLDELLIRGDIWKTDRAEFTWEIPAPEGVLNGPTVYNFGVSYKVTYQSSSVSQNYVNMQCTEVAEAYRDHSFKNREERIYGESYYKPSGNSHTLVRNPNYRYGNVYNTFDRPDLQIYLEYLDKATDLFNGNSFEIATQNQLGIPVVVLKYPLRNDPKNIAYLYQQEILQWLHDYNGLTKQLKKLVEETQKVGE